MTYRVASINKINKIAFQFRIQSMIKKKKITSFNSKAKNFSSLKIENWQA